MQIVGIKLRSVVAENFAFPSSLRCCRPKCLWIQYVCVLSPER